MPSLSFQKQFAAAVERGEKRQTIRTVRKNPIRVGDTLYLYTGMRTKVCRKLGEARCVEVIPIRVERAGVSLDGAGWLGVPTPTPLKTLDAFAQLDGFTGFTELCDWFETTHGLPFEGVLIRWELPDARR